MKILGNPDTVMYIGFDTIEQTGIAQAGYTLKCDWSYPFIAHEIGIRPEMTVHPKETHTCNVKKVTPSDGGEGTLRPSSLLDIDGVVTDEPGFALCMIMSDCAAIYIVDSVKRCIGLAHSGRKGTEGNIAAATVKKLSECYGTDPRNAVAAISPCICRNCYEVDALTAKKYVSCFKKEWQGDIMWEQNGRYYLDIASTIRLQLKEAGIQQIQMPDYCTCHNDYFFSYRRGDDDSNVAWLVLTEQS